MNKQIKHWLFFNGIFLAITVLAVFNISTPAVYVMYLIGWFIILITWLVKAMTYVYVVNPDMTPPETFKYEKRSMSKEVSYCYDIIILSLLVIGGYYVFAVFYATHVPLQDSIFKDFDTLLEQKRITPKQTDV